MKEKESGQSSPLSGQDVTISAGTLSKPKW